MYSRMMFILVFSWVLVSLAACGDDHDHQHEHAEKQAENQETQAQHEHEAHHDHAEGDVRKEHAAHEHGAARLTVATTDVGFEVTLETPAANVFGFEHTAATDEEQQAISDAKEKLTGVFTANNEAACELATYVLDTGDEQGGHSDIDARWAFKCAQPDQLNRIDVRLFSAFPQGFRHVNAEWITATGAGTQELEDDTSLVLY